VQHQVEEQARSQPNAPAAILWTGDRISYRQLNERANQLAHHLRGLGVGPDVPVGVMLERSHDLIISFLAVLKAGGCYLPMDPEYPPDRLAGMMEDARAPVLLVHRENAGRAMVVANTAAGSLRKAINLVCMEDFWEGPAKTCPTSNPLASSGPQTLAYILFTSGSTGRPKGVMVRQ
jgi:non-ribosomal peptide synthetase component F